MGILDELLSSAQHGSLQSAAKQFGFDETSAQALLKNLVPALSAGLKREVASGGGLENLTNALGRGNHQRFLDDPAALQEDAATTEGNGILGHLLGSKDASRQVASRAAENTGLDADSIKRFLPLVAATAMGALSRQTSRGANLAEDRNGALGLLGGLLDADGDGNVMDDLLTLGKKLF